EESPGPVRGADQRAAERRLRLPAAAVALGHTLGTLEPHGGVAHAVGADGPVAPLAADPRLPVGVPVARGNRLRGLLWLRGREGRLAGHARSLKPADHCRVPW